MLTGQHEILFNPAPEYCIDTFEIDGNNQVLKV